MHALKLAVSIAVIASSLGLALLACESATNLDVVYGDAAAAITGDGSSSEGGQGGEGGVPIGTPNRFTGCPCDESAGLGCCIPSGGDPPFCTNDTDLCNVKKQGELLKCGRPDPLTESTCCWTFKTPGSANGAVTALASACDGGATATACTADSDCSGTGKTCHVTNCKKVVIGQCADVAPPCPP